MRAPHAGQTCFFLLPQRSVQAFTYTHCPQPAAARSARSATTPTIPPRLATAVTAATTPATATATATATPTATAEEEEEGNMHNQYGPFALLSLCFLVRIREIGGLHARRVEQDF